MTTHKRKKLTAWLGLIAMWLIVFAPVVSQLVAFERAEQPIAALCSALQPGGPSDHSAGSLGASHDASLSACGYCDLLATHVAIPSVPATAMPALIIVVLGTVATLATRFTPLGAFPSGRPRAPPFVS
jgi:hypothetical protein